MSTTTPSEQPRASVLVINSGSSSIKYQLVSPEDGEAIASGIVERIGDTVGAVKHVAHGTTTKRELPVPDHAEGLRIVLGLFDELGPDLESAHVVAVGHRVVQGGALFDGPALVTPEVERDIEDLAPLAPLHNPANLTGIRVAQTLLPDVPHVVVFDTAFFRHLPEAAATYAIDEDVATRYRVRRYGAHGTSHQYVSQQVAQILGRPLEDLNQIVLHLGNGASASAVRGGVAVETSMGLTPLEGLVMGTRSGDVDPAILIHLYRNAGMSIDELDDLLNRRSGVKGLSGVSDFRALHDLVAQGEAGARRALDVYLHRLRKYIGAYHAVLGRLDVITFTAGIGENDDIVRAGALAGLEALGIEVDLARNEGRKSEPTVISPDGAKVTVLVVPTNEELAIARQALEVVGA
ncbi:acetate kinase [Cellulomonas sp. zg-ZUI222]|uniref:Acetate kinase n=1 Tax=Cellulomonas wangleii TaxID=2816956 RepID=A0ABX8D1N5_9CELL|nr:MULTISPECIES: acetate kinase [Cellulomonas]MBO0899722.1 acetate kinase [Cellulomonas sp. zg-ZUI22]MBO0920584.1 acetate kinase [Cellulomonas wangleii]MBO0922998.1 acetate kinase [Cellulomonas wangleii]QVI61386.1 acetate kinase [Cellulomonas wangleii]